MNKCHVCSLVASMTISLVIGCGGESSPVTPSAVSVTPTITISDTGVNPTELRISVGQQVRFINNSTKMHEMRSTPHPVHTDCPPINMLPVLSAGQSGLTGALRLWHYPTLNLFENWPARLLKPVLASLSVFHAKG